MTITLFLFGILTGFLGTLIGIGGGVFLIPFLLLVCHLNPQFAIGTSLFVIVFNAFSGTLAYARYKRIQYSIGLLIIAYSIPGIILGAYISSFFNNRIFKIIFSVILILIAINLLIKNNTSQKHKDNPFTPIKLNRRKNIILFFIGLSSGFVAASLGIGGGVIHVPVLIYFLSMPVQLATATSQFILLNTALLSIIPHAIMNHIDYPKGFLLGSGAFIGAQIGAYISSKISSRLIIIILGSMLIIVAIKLLW
ncbi:MAG: sulfite exporter TauE/SafE family protein [Planctomycetota bacterium]